MAKSIAFTARPFRKTLLCCAAAMPLALIANASLAQVAPSTVEPSRVEGRFKEPTTQVKKTSDFVGAQEQGAVPVANSLNKQLNKSFTLHAVQVDDTSVYPAGTFDSLFASKIGKKTTLAELRGVVREITTRYRKDGYVLSQAVIPSQSLEGGVLHIRVVEGFVDKVIVNIDNPKVDRRGLVEAYGKKISELRPLSTAKLERYMLLVNDLPGLKAKATLRPSTTTFGAADLVIDVTSKQIGASFTSDNRGNKYIGPWQEQATVTENSLLGLGERTTIRGINTIPTSELHFFDIQHEEQVGSEGTRVIGRAAFTRTRPGDTLKPLDLSGLSDDYSISVVHPVIRSRAENLNVTGMFEARNGVNDAFGNMVSNDRIRALRGGLTYDTSDRFDGSDLMSAQVSQGVSWFNATDRGAGRGSIYGDPNFLKMNMDISRIQNLPNGFSFLTAATGQVASYALPASEQFALGGVGFGQAYDSGEISGDQGLAGKLELRYGKAVGYRYLDSFQLYSYYDIGSVFTRAGAASTPKEQSLASVGAGVRANLNDNFYGYLEAGWPLTHVISSENNRDPRLFFSVTGRY